MKNNINIFYVGKEDLKSTKEYIKNININNNIQRFVKSMFDTYEYQRNIKNDDMYTRIVLTNHYRGMRGNICLYTKEFEKIGYKNDLWWLANIGTRDYDYITNRILNAKNKEFPRYLVAPISILDKILNEDITYVVINNDEEYKDKKYITNDVVSVISYIRQYKDIDDIKKEYVIRKCEIKVYNKDMNLILNISDKCSFREIVEKIADIHV
ncbi:TPA: hypothetical protein ACF2DD_002085 [Clostridium perfringens]